MRLVTLALRVKHFVTLEVFTVGKLTVSDNSILEGSAIDLRWQARGCDSIQVVGYMRLPGYITGVRIVPERTLTKLTVIFHRGKDQHVRTQPIKVIPLILQVDDQLVVEDFTEEVTSLCKQDISTRLATPKIKGLKRLSDRDARGAGIRFPAFVPSDT